MSKVSPPFFGSFGESEKRSKSKERKFLFDQEILSKASTDVGQKSTARTLCPLLAQASASNPTPAPGMRTFPVLGHEGC